MPQTATERGMVLLSRRRSETCDLDDHSPDFESQRNFMHRAGRAQGPGSEELLRRPSESDGAGVGIATSLRDDCVSGSAFQLTTQF